MNKKDNQSFIGTETIELPGVEATELTTSSSVNKSVVPQQLFLDQDIDSIESQWDFACEIHKYIRSYITSADNKANWFVAFSAASVLWLNKNKYTDFWGKYWKEWVILDMLSFVSLASLSLCVVSSLFVIFPRLKGSIRGIVFFKSIAKYESSSDFAKDICRKNKYELTVEMLKHSHELAVVCSNKFYYISWSIGFGAIGVVSGLAVIIIGE